VRTSARDAAADWARACASGFTAEEDFDNRAAFTEPEILRTNLASVILQMKALGLGDLEDVPLHRASR
jgi:hypothetical protein